MPPNKILYLNYYIFLFTSFILLIASGKGLQKCYEEAADKWPNIPWITIEVWSSDFSYYSTKGIYTPNVDKLAYESILYESASTTSPVGSTSCSAIITGFYQNYIGTNQHRVKCEEKEPLPYGIKPISKLIEEAGYFTTLMSLKSDVNFVPYQKEGFFIDISDWTKDNYLGWYNRNPGQFFFARITLGVTHRSRSRDPQRPMEIKDVENPYYYVDNEFVLRELVDGLEQMPQVDREVEKLFQILKEEGLSDNTIVFFIDDQEHCHIRGKQFLFDDGIEVPLIMRCPSKIDSAQVNEDMFMSPDIDASILEEAGITTAVTLLGESPFGDEVKNRKYIFTARDNMEETHNAMRTIRSKDYKLILDLMPERSHLQYNHYKEGSYPVLAAMNILNLEVQLASEKAILVAPKKQKVELIDPSNDPYEVDNMVANYTKLKETLLRELDNRI